MHFQIPKILVQQKRKEELSCSFRRCVLKYYEMSYSNLFKTKGHARSSSHQLRQKLSEQKGFCHATSNYNSSHSQKIKKLPDKSCFQHRLPANKILANFKTQQISQSTTILFPPFT